MFLLRLILVIALGNSTTLWADTTITYQGRLDSGGQPHTGAVQMRFRLFNQATGGSFALPSINRTVQVEDGLFQVELDWGDRPYEAGRWLEIAVEGQVLTPRQRITGVPFALRVPSALQPLAFGRIHFSGSVVNGSGNFSSQWNAAESRYEITIDGHDYHIHNYSAVATPIGEVTQGISTDSHLGMLIILTAGGSPTSFSFIAYKGM